jgi:hypothetical protein
VARTLKKFEPVRERYPWATWANGKIWRVERGEDFSCTAHGFRQQLYAYAKLNSLKVRATIKGDAVEFQFSKS